MAPITFPKAGKAQEAATKSVADLKAEVQDRIDKIHTTEQEQSAYLSSDDIAELQKMENLLQGSLALLDQFEKTGAITPIGVGATAADGTLLSSATMNTGWNGGFQSDTTDPNCEVIMPYNQGTDIKNALVFKMDDTMESVKAKNVGTDIEFTVTYKDKTIPTKTYLLKDMATNPTPLIIAADQTTLGVKVDLSQVKRTTGGITIIGGSGSDTLIGSQGDDQIFGNLGDDKIYGMGGKNKLDGGAGTDTINSVNKFDAINGGEGYDTADATEKDAANAATFTEKTNITKTTSANKDEIFNSPGNGWKAEEMDGELSITKNAANTDGGAINLTVPDGMMVYSKEDGNDLVLTYQPVGEDGIPGEPQVVRIHDVLNSSSRAKITITSESGPDHPAIIDLGGVNTQFNQVTLVKGQGDDMIIAPQTAMGGINVGDLGTPSSAFDTTTTKKINAAMEKDSTHFWATGDNGDYLKPFPGWKTPPKVGTGEVTLYPKDGQETLELQEPEVDGYSMSSCVAEQSADGKETTLTLFMKKDGWKQGDALERFVIHVVKSADGNPKTITVGSMTPQDGGVITKLVANEGDTGGGVFVGPSSSTDKSKAGDNEVIDK